MIGVILLKKSNVRIITGNWISKLSEILNVLLFPLPFYNESSGTKSHKE